MAQCGWIMSVPKDRVFKLVFFYDIFWGLLLFGYSICSILWRLEDLKILLQTYHY